MSNTHTHPSPPITCTAPMKVPVLMFLGTLVTGVMDGELNRSRLVRKPRQPTQPVLYLPSKLSTEGVQRKTRSNHDPSSPVHKEDFPSGRHHVFITGGSGIRAERKEDRRRKIISVGSDDRRRGAGSGYTDDPLPFLGRIRWLFY